MSTDLSKWVFLNATGLILCTGMALWIQMVYPVLVGAGVSFLALISIYRRMWLQLGPLGGIANQVTLGRLILLICVLGLRYELTTGVFVVGIVIVMIADGIDGFLARRMKIQSPFGAVFDAEVDAFMALSLTVVLWLDHSDAYWLLVAGLLRYLFAVLYQWLGWKGSRPEMYEAKIYAVLFFISLLVPWVLQWEHSRWITGAGCILVAFSFVKEFFLMLDTHVINKKRG